MKEPWGDLHLIEEPIMTLRRRRRHESYMVMRDAFIILAPIALTVATVLWFVH